DRTSILQLESEGKSGGGIPQSVCSLARQRRLGNATGPVCGQAASSKPDGVFKQRGRRVSHFY
ncbi:hypothetical protein LBW46_22610, partial [Ralstonia solanacearum]